MATLASPADNGSGNPFANLDKGRQPWKPAKPRKPRSTDKYHAVLPIGIHECGLSKKAIAAYSWLSARYGGYEAGMFPKVGTIAAGLGVSVRTAQYALTELEAAGWLTVETRPPQPGRRGNGTNVYMLTTGSEEAARVRKAGTRRGKAKAQLGKGANSCTPGVQNPAPFSGSKPQVSLGIPEPKPERVDNRDSLLLEEEARRKDPRFAPTASKTTAPKIPRWQDWAASLPGKSEPEPEPEPVAVERGMPVTEPLPASDPRSVEAALAAWEPPEVTPETARKLTDGLDFGQPYNPA